MKRMGLISIVVALLALSGIGVGYAYWSSTITITGTVNTATLDWKFISPLGQLDNSVQLLDSGNDYNFDPGNLDLPAMQIENNIGYVGGRITNPHLIEVQMYNVYPGYYNELYTKIQNIGTIPLRVKGARLIYNGESYPIHYVDGGGDYLTTNDGAFAFRWINNAADGLIIYPVTPSTINKKYAEEFAIYVINPAFSTQNETQTYNFSILLDAEQFNEP